MQFLNWFLNPVKNQYAEFSGRASRKEFWMFILVYFIIYIVLSVIDGLVGTNGIIAGIFSLAVIIPSVAIGARRLHDTGMSGWWQLLGLIPMIGTIIIIVLMARKGEVATNKFGMPPGGAASAGAAAAMGGVPPTTAASEPVTTPPQAESPESDQSEG